MIPLESKESDRDRMADTGIVGVEPIPRKLGTALVLLLLFLPCCCFKSIRTLLFLGEGGQVDFRMLEFVKFLGGRGGL